MKRHFAENGLEWLTFDLLSEFPQLIHGVFLRHGGVSQGDFGSLNFGFSSGDILENVSRNRKKVLEAMNLTSWTSLFQAHGDLVVEAKPGINEIGDGLMTNTSNLALFILHADCQAAIFYDPIHHALANIHCGWRGNVQGIYSKTVQAMEKRFGTKPQDVLVAISPSLGPQAAEFINYQKELPQEFYPFQIRPTYFNLWEISKWQLKQAGVLENHIEIASLCTFQNEKDFFSYRRVKKSGRHATIAALK